MPITTTEIFAPLPDIERGKPYVLGADPKGKNFLYYCAKGVIIRDIENPMKCDVVSKHAKKISAAQYSPSGFYICSADIAGNIKIWDTVNKEHIVKNEYRPMTGHIKDISWGPESKRIAVCGAGNEIHAAAILADGGTSVGKITSVNQRANSISYRPVRPYRIAVGDDKYFTGFYAGPPFKHAKTSQDHSNFVQTVRYSHDGKYLATGGSDGQVYLYEAKESELIGHLEGENGKAHGLGVYSVSWSPDSKQLLTVSADQSVKIWDVETRKEIEKYTMDQQQNASLWMNDYLLSVSRGGQINYLDRKNPGKVSKVLEGHSKPITKILKLSDGHVTGDLDGKMLKWNTETGEAQTFSGTGHKGHKINGIVYDSCNDEIVTVGWDNQMIFTPAASSDFSASTNVSLNSQPICLGNAGNGYFILICHESVVLVKDKKVVFDMKHPERFSHSCVAASGMDVAIDGKGQKVNIYHIEGETLTKSDVAFDVGGGAVTMSYSPDGSILAVSSVNKIIDLKIVADGYKNHRSLVGHNLKANVIAWSPDSQYLATSGLDCTLRVWCVAKKNDQIVERAHGNNFIVDMTWNSDNSLLSVGDDILTKQWSITF